MVLEIGIFGSQFIWLWRVRHVRRAAKKAGKTYDEYVAEHPSKRFAHSESSDSIPDIEAGTIEPVPITPLEKCKTKENGAVLEGCIAIDPIKGAYSTYTNTHSPSLDHEKVPSPGQQV